MLAHIRELCFLSMLCGTVLCLTPDGGVKRILSILSALLLASSLLSAVRELDFESYAIELSRYREQEQSFLAEQAERDRRLNRLVIEEEVRTYILDKAETLGLHLENTAVELRWCTDGFWVPDAVSTAYRGEEWQREQMQDLIMGDLGIPAERQYWYHDR